VFSNKKSVIWNFMRAGGCWFRIIRSRA